MFALMVLLGWWASGRLPQEDEMVSLDEHGQHQSGHAEAEARAEETEGHEEP